MSGLNLVGVTITGIDERTDLTRVAELGKCYSFAEWAFLLSLSRSGYEPRYPSPKVLREAALYLGNECLQWTAVHLCGALARDAAEFERFAIHTAITMAPDVRRVQINLGDGLGHYGIGFLENLEFSAMDHSMQVIVQAHSFDSSGLNDWSERCLNSVPSPRDEGLVVLFDPSGGRGKAAQWIAPPVPYGLVGYAGGITPDNVASRLTELATLGIDNPIWIDMESGVRTDDWLDLDKVERVLEIASAFVVQTAQEGSVE